MIVYERTFFFFIAVPPPIAAIPSKDVKFYSIIKRNFIILQFLRNKQGSFIKLVSKELKYLAAILQHYARRLIFMKHFLIINFQKEEANTFTLLIILIVKSLQIELHSTNLLL